jgi:hypothetical protein
LTTRRKAKNGVCGLIPRRGVDAMFGTLQLGDVFVM